MTVVEGKRSAIGSAEDEEPSSEALIVPDVVAEKLGGRYLSPSEYVVLLHTLNWKNPGNKARIEALRYELALTKMGVVHPGFDQLVHSEWQQESAGTYNGTLWVRTTSVHYQDQGMQLGQLQKLNSYGRLIEECFVLLVPSEYDGE